MFNVYKNQLSQQTGSRNLTGPKTFPTIWHTYMKLVTKYQIPVINSCWEKCDEKWAYMFNVYKNQQNRQTGSRNLMGPKTLPMIWGTYMKLVTKNQISAKQELGIWWVQKYFPQYGIPIWHLWPNIRFLPSTVTEKNATKNILDGQTDRGKTVYPPPFGERGYKKNAVV
jgi:hypothetical protein